MADRFISWPPSKEALIPLVKALARAAAEADVKREQAFLQSGRHSRRSFSPADPEDKSSIAGEEHEVQPSGGQDDGVG